MFFTKMFWIENPIELDTNETQFFLIILWFFFTTFFGEKNIYIYIFNRTVELNRKKKHFTNKNFKLVNVKLEQLVFVRRHVDGFKCCFLWIPRNLIIFLLFQTLVERVYFFIARARKILNIRSDRVHDFYCCTTLTRFGKLIDKFIC